MPRARNIKWGFFTNELLGSYDPIISLTFAGLWGLADRNGILEDRPLRMRGEMFPYRENIDMNSYLTVLERDDFLIRYEVKGTKYIQIKNFKKHQSPHHTEKAKGFPFPPIKQDINQTLDINSDLTVKSLLIDGDEMVLERSDLLIPDSLIQNNNNNTPTGITYEFTLSDELIESTLEHLFVIGLYKENEHGKALEIIDFELKKFLAYNIKKNSLMVDWDACWLSWVYKIENKKGKRLVSSFDNDKTLGFIQKHTDQSWRKNTNLEKKNSAFIEQATSKKWAENL